MKIKHKSKMVKHTACMHCSSSDAYTVYEDGSGYCFSCETYDANSNEIEVINLDEQTQTNFLESSFNRLESRGIELSTCQKYSYGCGFYFDKPAQIASYYVKRKLVAQHIRLPDKSFKWVGDAKHVELFGQHLFETGKKALTITEGEIDCLTIAQCFECKWPVVSIPSGIQSAYKYLQQNLEFVDSFEEIILAFDDDEPGKEGVEKCMQLFKPGKVKVMSYDGYKDANELFLAKGSRQVKDCWWNAQTYRPDGILAAKDLWHEMIKPVPLGYDLPYMMLNKMTYGIRKNELTLFTAGSSIGKSTFVKEIAYHLFNHHSLKVGVLALEENITNTMRALAGIHINKPLARPGVDCDIDLLRQTFDAVFNNDRVYLYDHFGSSDVDAIVSKIRYMIVACGCDFVVIDHLSIIVSGLSEKDSGESERKTIDIMMTKLRQLVNETGAGVLAIVHVKRPGGNNKSYNEGGTISLTDLRGSASLEQLSDIVIALERNQQGDTPNQSKVRVLKNRATGTTGLADTLNYQFETGRLLPLDLNNLTESKNDETRLPKLDFERV